MLIGKTLLESWINIELAALSAARALLGDELRNKTLSYQAIRALEHSRVLDETAVSMLRDLRALRNEAAHAPDFAVSPATALDYALTASRLTSYLELLAEKPPVPANGSPTNLST
jgi:hypothetical protein